MLNFIMLCLMIVNLCYLINFKCKKGVKINSMFDGLNDNIKFICNEPTFYNLFIQRNKKI